MQKWCPEPFTRETAVAEAPPRDGDVAFEPAAQIGAEPDSAVRLFRREAGFADTKALMNSLTREERSQVYELVQMDLEDDYKAREAELAATHAAEVAALEKALDTRFAAWSEALAATLADDMREAASAAARLAVALAERIVRGTVAVDPAAVARVIETTLFKVPAGQPVTVRLHPDEAAWLEGQDGLRARLHIGEIVADRRVDPGGCVVSCAGREWDATLAGQLEALSEVVGEMIATAAPGTPRDSGRTADPEDGREPGVD